MVELTSVRRPPRTERAEWERQYSAGRWRYLAGRPETARYDRIAHMVEWLGTSPAVLDVGCGECLLYHRMGGPRFPGRYLGVDWSTAALPRGPWGPGHGVICAEAARLPVDDEFDVIVCSEVLYYLDDPWSAVKAFRKMLTADGHLIISLFRPDPARHPDWHAHINGLDKELTNLLGASSEQVVADRTWTIYTLRKERAS